MADYDVIIAGGGVSGLSCALTLASGIKDKDWAQGKKVLVIDAGESDLKKAMLNNVPGIPQGTRGDEALASLKKQVEAYGTTEFIEGKVTAVNGSKGSFKVELADSKSLEADQVVIATGFHGLEIESLKDKIRENENSPRPGKIELLADKESRVSEGLYVAGLIAGVSTMYAAAAGSGVQTACHIFKTWTGKNTIVHDVPG